jgi:eukaryotic-like serine/threonine-protein kinase
MIDAGTVIDGRYLVVSRIGSGGMADVYLAEDQLLGRKVAVKVLHHHFAEDVEFVERFRREASSAAGLSHPNVVSVFDRGEWNETYYIAMEYLPGRSLKALVREHGALEPAAAIDIVIQVLRATRFAHRRGVIHRDLKPHNVILDEEGRAKVTDFGIARAGASDMTLTGSIMGTAQYLSPEQAQGHAVSESADLYAIGIVLYELLTGAVPFDGETAVAIALKQVSAEPHPPSVIAHDVPPALDAVVLRALAKDPASRFADADEFIVALQHVRAELPTPVGEHVLAGAPLWPEAATQSPGQSMFVSAGAPGVAPLLEAPLLVEEEPGAANVNGASSGREGRFAWLWRRRLWIAAGITLALVAAAIGLSLGSSKVTVPNVTGRSAILALAIVRHAGLTPVSVEASSTNIPKGIVIAEFPAHGSVLQKGSHVRVVVSSGLPHVQIASVSGLTGVQATATLSGQGLRPTVKPQASESVPKGMAIGTLPPKGNSVQADSRVTLFVSSGRAPVDVPTLVGSSKEAAITALGNAGLKLGAVTSKVSSGHPVGTVISQSPAAGSSVQPGSEVSVVVSAAPKLLVLPSVVGEAGEVATETLRAQGFTVNQAHTPVSDPLLVGLVVKQTPSAGHKVHPGSEVTVTVGVAQTTTTTTSSTTSTSSSSTTTTTSTSTAAPGPP